ncbi:MAG TPA: ATP-binding protein, partial [Pyrinomonadaceae bacterium]
ARAIFESRGGGASQFRWLRKDGRAVHVEAQSRVILDGRGEPAGMRGVTMDITERKAAVEALTASRARLEGIVDSAMDAIVSVGEDQRVLLFNHAAEKMFRCAAAEALGRPLDDFVPERFRGEHRGHVESFGQTGVTSRAMAGARAVAGLRSDGGEFPLEASISQVEAGGQKLYTVIMRDTTERKASEERLRFLAEASRVLGSSLDYEATLAGLARLAVEAVADYCLVDLVDDDGRVRRVAAAHRDPARQPLAERLRAFPPGPQSAGIPRVLRTGQPEVFPEVTGETIPALSRDGEHARLLGELGLKSFVAVPLVARGRTIGALTFSSTRAAHRYTDEDVAYAQEIAARAALAIENARLYARAQEVNRAKDEFLATLSHELRTPLTPILGWTHMIRSGRLGDAEVAQGVRVIEKNSQSLSRLINDLLDMSSILSGKMRIERAPVELGGVVREAADTVRPQADARSVSLEVQTGGLAPVVVSGDRTRLVQVFWNLLHNAVKFSPEGGRVRVRVGGADGAARVEVEDEGSGIAPEFLPHVFERFRQADMATTRAHGGLGLGLALVKSFVEAHGGSVRAESAGPDRGSRFTVALPAAEADGARRPAGDPAPPEPCDERACNVLLIEDAPDTLEMLKVAFESRGYTVAACPTPEEALRVAESGRFDIIVSDIGLPRIDGHELLARLRELPHLREVPALALTGYAAQRDAEAALAAGFGAHVPKPVDPAELAERIDQLTRRATDEKKE